MTTTSPEARAADSTAGAGYPVTEFGHTVEPRRSTAETKPSSKTSELYVYLAAVLGVLVASYLVKTTGGHADYFRADQAWFFVVLLSIGYMASRGLAKAGSRDHHHGS